MLKELVGAGLLLVVAGCESDSGPSQREIFRQNVNAWIGHTESELIESAGPPSATAVLDGGDRVLSWDLIGSRPDPGAFITGPANTMQYIPGGNSVVTCRVTYKVSGKKIVAANVSPNC